jgi:hypothetical protein
VTKVILSIPVTIDRNSTAIRIDEAGLLEIVAPDKPRFYFDLVTFQPQGLLIESAAANCINGEMATYGLIERQNSS